MYESNSNFVKSEYSQLQYNWCPTVCSVITGLRISSIKYSRHRDGIAINTKVTAAAIVQIVPIICHSKINNLVCLFLTILIIV